MTLDRDRLAAVTGYLRGMASDALGHAYTVTPQDGEVCREAALLLDAAAEEAVRLRDAVDRVTALAASWECGNGFGAADSLHAKVCPDCYRAAALTDALGEGDTRDCDACHGTGTRRRHIGTAACSRCGGTGEAAP